MPFKDPVKRREYQAQHGRKSFRKYYALGLCPRCEEHRPLELEFSACAPCRAKANAYARNYRSQPQNRIARSYEHKKNKYGITQEQFIEMLTKQNGVCAICHTLGYQRSQAEPTLGLCIDHNHQTGIVRGLLCYRCNAALGNLSDNITLVESALTYLKERI